MTSVRKRVEMLERTQSVRGGAGSDEIVRRVLGRVSDPDLELFGSAARVVAQRRELTPAECAVAEAYASAVAPESAALRSPGGQKEQLR